MFYHSKITEGKFSLFTLSNGHSELQIVPERGGIVSELKLGDRQILYMDSSTLYDTSKSTRGGIPILFPICGYLENDTYIVNGMTYHMKRHGFARNYPWDVSYISASDAEASIITVFHDNQKTYEEYPFHFHLSIKYVITADNLSIETEIKNDDEKPMPFYLGFHPYFNVSDKNLLSVEVHSDKFIEKIPGGLIDGKINFDADEVNISYYDLQDNSCQLSDVQNGLNIKLCFDDSFKYITLWSLKGSDFVCLEPWMAYVDSMNTGRDLNYLEPGKVHRSKVSISADNK